MSTRFNSQGKNKLGVQPLPTGYEGGKDLPDITIPSCGIEDVDVSLFDLFDKEISPQIASTEDKPPAKVPVIFAAGEKWALLKKGRLLRDKNNTLIIPLITIMRTDVIQDISSDITGRGINQQVGEIVIRRKIDKSNKDYQSVVNRFLLRNQSNLAVDNRNDRENLGTGGNIGDLQQRYNSGEIGLLTPELNNTIMETIVVPTPQFYTAKYQVTVWTQFMQHSNVILERIISSLLPQAQSWRLDTKKGYWFIATLDGGYTTETNFEDMSQQERFIKHTFNITVPAYFFATKTPGSPVPIKRYVFSPVVRFEPLTDDPSNSASYTGEYRLGDDDPTLPLDLQRNIRDDQRPPGWRQQKIYPINEQDVDDPALDIQLQRRRQIREISRNAKGEAVYSGASLDGLNIGFK